MARFRTFGFIIITVVPLGSCRPVSVARCLVRRRESADPTAPTTAGDRRDAAGHIRLALREKNYVASMRYTVLAIVWRR